MSNSYRIGPPGQRREIDVRELKQHVRLSAIVERRVKLRRSGNALSGLCPFHEERTPSFYVRDELGLYYCHGCGRGGDVIEFVRESTNCRFIEALEWLTLQAPHTAAPIIEDPGRARLYRQLHIDQARRIWRDAQPIEGTPAQAYLAARGIVGRIPGMLRFGFAPVRINPDTGAYGPKLPAMIAACQDVDGSIMGIQRTFLTRDGTKARMNNPRLSLGQIRGGALRLEPEASTLTLCEGIEDGLSLVRMFPGMSVWVALGAGNLPFVMLPASVKRVILAGDADAPGQAAVAVARQACEARRLKVEEMYPAGGFGDFNAEWITLHCPDLNAR